VQNLISAISGPACGNIALYLKPVQIDPIVPLLLRARLTRPEPQSPADIDFCQSESWAINGRRVQSFSALLKDTRGIGLSSHLDIAVI